MQRTIVYLVCVDGLTSMKFMMQSMRVDPRYHRLLKYAILGINGMLSRKFKLVSECSMDL